MPRFHFHLRAGGTIHRDPHGIECANAEAARSHAVAVAAELMRKADPRTRHWSIRVEDFHGEPSFDVFFADVDSLRGELSPELQALVAQTCRRYGALVDVLCAARVTWAESGRLLARAQGRPRLVYADGRLR